MSRKKSFDAVALMRSSRDKISAEIEHMTLEEELAWLSSQEIKDPFLRRLSHKASACEAVSQGAVADSFPCVAERPHASGIPSS